MIRRQTGVGVCVEISRCTSIGAVSVSALVTSLSDTSVLFFSVCTHIHRYITDNYDHYYHDTTTSYPSTL